MKTAGRKRARLVGMVVAILAGATPGLAQDDAPLPAGVKAVWDLGRAYREQTPTRERVCLNGLWRWQPVKELAGPVPAGNWGFFKVPGPWPGITDYLQKDCQSVYAHPNWQGGKLGDVVAAWYQREIAIPAEWAGRRLAVSAECVNSAAIVYVDGQKAGETPLRLIIAAGPHSVEVRERGYQAVTEKVAVASQVEGDLKVNLVKSAP